MYLPPNATFDERYLVRRKVTVSQQPAALTPQVGVALSRYYSAARQDHWVTTAMVPDSSAVLTNPYGWQKDLGYLMTKPPTGVAVTELDDCYIAAWDDHMVGVNGDCGGAQNLRVLGWIYASSAPQPAGTTPIYRCYNASQTNHVVSDVATCEGLGALDWIIGYTLAP